jgi:hypothetical protein
MIPRSTMPFSNEAFDDAQLILIPIGQVSDMRMRTVYGIRESLTDEGYDKTLLLVDRRSGQENTNQVIAFERRSSIDTV